jgi:hypothetical protein
MKKGNIMETYRVKPMVVQAEMITEYKTMYVNALAMDVQAGWYFIRYPDGVETVMDSASFDTIFQNTKVAL